ncbi:MAG: PepSY-associated TM helix domain-containing protein [Bacteroidota bacterium]
MIKKIIAWLHLWLGLVSGIVVIVLGITGCVLVFEQEIKSVTSPWLHVTHAAGEAQLLPSVLYRQVKQALPDKEISSVWYYGPNRTAQVFLDADSTVYVNPYTAEIVSITNTHEDFFHFIEDGHFYLWLPKKIGEILVNWGTLLFFVLTVTGIVLWWPKRWNKKGVDQSFKIRWNAKLKRVNYDLHNVLGFYSLIIALLMAFTGLVMSFSWFNKGVYWLSGGENTPFVKAASDSTLAGNTQMLRQVDKAWLICTTQIAEYNKDQVIVSFPNKPSDAIELSTDMHAGSWRYVYLDQYTLKELPGSQAKLKDEQLALWLRRSNYTLHVGAIGGFTTKIIYFLASLICASLPVTGFYIWWGKKRKAWRQANKGKPILIPS